MIALLTLGVGLDMNTAVYSIVRSVLPRSLPYPQPERLASLWEEDRRPDDIKVLNSSGAGLGGTTGGKRRTTVTARHRWIRRRDPRPPGRAR